MESTVQKSELYFLILHLLASTPCQESVEVLERELRENGLLPRKFNWQGQSRPATYEELREDHASIEPAHLEKLLSRLLSLSHALNPTPTSSNTLIGTRAYSLLPEVHETQTVPPDYQPDLKKAMLSSILTDDREPESALSIMEPMPTTPTSTLSTTTTTSIPNSTNASNTNNNNNINGNNNTNTNNNTATAAVTTVQVLPPALQKAKLKSMREKRLEMVTMNVISPISCNNSSIVSRLVSKELRGTRHIAKTPPICIYNRFHKLKAAVGHKDAMYCLKFDQNGTRIFSGSDDFLVKVWSVETARLIATLRGHEGEITDMAINVENTLLATSSTDNTIRVWNLQTYAQEAVLVGHSRQEPNVITTVSFCPASKVLISGDNFGECKIWNIAEFNQPTQNPGTVSCTPNTIKCLSISKGGSCFATVGDNIVRVWSISPTPQLVAQLKGHRESVYYVQYSHFTNQIVTGSDDGTCRIWTPQGNKTWRSVALLPKLGNAPARKIGSVRMAIWSCDDRIVIGAAEKTILVWDSITGALQHCLSEHNREVYVLDCHPTDPRIAMSAGYDGVLILWDIVKGTVLYKTAIDPAWIGNELTDGCFSRSGAHMAVSSMAGKVHIFGTGSDFKYSKTPEEQFFMNDYWGVVRDQNGWVLDERTQLPPHLARTPIVSYDNVAYEPQPPPPPPPFLIDPAELAYTREKQMLILKMELNADANVSRNLVEQPEEAPLLPAKPPPRRRNRPWREPSPSPEASDSGSEPSGSDSEFSGEDDDDEEEEEDDPMAFEAPDDPNKDEDYSEPHPVTRVRPRIIKKKKSPIKTKSGRTVRRVAREYDSEDPYSESDSDAPELGSEDEKALEITPSKKRPPPRTTWITIVERTSLDVASYVPQLNDNVMYFYQGHEKYKQKYPDNLRDPKTVITGLPPMQECKVIKISYKLNLHDNVVYSRLTLAPTLANSTVTFQVNYHASTEPDYLVLASRVRHALSNEDLWKPLRHFRMYYSDKHKYFYGKVVEMNQEIPGSWWDGLLVDWYMGETNDIVSPWEIEPIEPPNTTISTNNDTNNNNNSLENTNTTGETENIGEQPTTASTTTTTTTTTTTSTTTNTSTTTSNANNPEETADVSMSEDSKVDIEGVDGEITNYPLWILARDFEESKAAFEECIPAAERDRILAIVREVFDDPLAAVFQRPVNLRKEPTYKQICPHPIDLSMIIRRLENNYYRREEAVLFDLRLMHRNAFSYNRPDSDIVKWSRIIHRRIAYRITSTTTTLSEDAPLAEIENEIAEEDREDEHIEEIDNKGKGKSRSKGKGKAKGSDSNNNNNTYNNNNNNNNNYDMGANKYGEGSSNGIMKQDLDKETLEESQRREYSLRSRNPSTLNENITLLKQKPAAPRIVVKLKGQITNGLNLSSDMTNPSNAARDESALSREQKGGTTSESETDEGSEYEIKTEKKPQIDRKRKRPEKYSDDEYSKPKKGEEYDSEFDNDSDEGYKGSRANGQSRYDPNRPAIHRTRSATKHGIFPEPELPADIDTSVRRSTRESKPPQKLLLEFEDPPPIRKSSATSPPNDSDDSSSLRRSARNASSTSINSNNSNSVNSNSSSSGAANKKMKVESQPDLDSELLALTTRSSERKRVPPQRLVDQQETPKVRIRLKRGSDKGEESDYEGEEAEGGESEEKEIGEKDEDYTDRKVEKEPEPPKEEKKKGAKEKAEKVVETRTTRSKAVKKVDSDEEFEDTNQSDNDFEDYESESDEGLEEEEEEEESEEEYGRTRRKFNANGNGKSKSKAKSKGKKSTSRRSKIESEEEEEEEEEEDEWEEEEEEERPKRTRGARAPNLKAENRGPSSRNPGPSSEESRSSRPRRAVRDKK